MPEETAAQWQARVKREQAEDARIKRSGAFVSYPHVDEPSFDKLDHILPQNWAITTAGPQTNTPRGIVAGPTAGNPLRAQVSWPGVLGNVVSFQYTNSHGIQPGGALLTVLPVTGTVASFGSLGWCDGIRPPIILRDCHLDHTDVSLDEGGGLINLHISDRRWRWTQSYEIAGEYNRYDDHGNLVPWTVQSASELAVLCLKRMGERKYKIAFPPGLTSKQASKYDRWLRAGERFPLTTANPYVNWNHIPAAVALQRLCDTFGCRLMLDPITDTVCIYPIGYGDGLPPGSLNSVASASFGIENKRVPKRIGIMGAPMKFQVRLALEPVAEEWDGFYVPYKKASYAPVLTTNETGPDVRGWDYAAPDEFPTVTPTERLRWDEARSLAQKCIFKAYRVRETPPPDLPDSTLALLTGSLKENNPAGWDVSNQPGGIRIPGLADPIVTGSPISGRKTSNVDRSEFSQAGETAVGIILGPQLGPVASGGVGAIVAGLQSAGILNSDDRSLDTSDLFEEKAKFAFIKRRTQIVMTPTKVQQVKPADRRDTDIVQDPNSPSGTMDPGSLPPYYNGFSRDVPMECFGTYHSSCSNMRYNLTTDIITKRRIYLPFELIPEQQIVMFGQYLWTLKVGGAKPAAGGAAGDIADQRVFDAARDLYIETGVYVLDDKTNAPHRPHYWLDIPGGTAPEVWEIQEDIITHIVGKYDSNNFITGYTVDDFGDGAKRAKYYLNGMKRRFLPFKTQTARYNGILTVSPSGALQQICWQMSGGSITTTASTNGEFSQTVPPYSVRKLEENLPPNEIAKMLNLVSGRDTSSSVKQAVGAHAGRLRQ